jgi:hypothetical protein
MWITSRTSNEEEEGPSYRPLGLLECEYRGHELSESPNSHRKCDRITICHDFLEIDTFAWDGECSSSTATEFRDSHVLVIRETHRTSFTVVISLKKSTRVYYGKRNQIVKMTAVLRQ